ncbi:hypothetical protein TNCV_298541 [Trichonephila clavipes]|nr:hypothetical protein TNCV_298541 [Trichonephila clavipes]
MRAKAYCAQLSKRDPEPRAELFERITSAVNNVDSTMSSGVWQENWTIALKFAARPRLKHEAPVKTGIPASIYTNVKTLSPPNSKHESLGLIDFLQSPCEGTREGRNSEPRTRDNVREQQGRPPKKRVDPSKEDLGSY